MIRRGSELKPNHALHLTGAALRFRAAPRFAAAPAGELGRWPLDIRPQVKAVDEGKFVAIDIETSAYETAGGSTRGRRYLLFLRHCTRIGFLI